MDGEGHCVAVGDVPVWQIKGLWHFPETKLLGEGGGLLISTENQHQSTLLQFLAQIYRCDLKPNWASLCLSLLLEEMSLVFEAFI